MTVFSISKSVTKCSSSRILLPSRHWALQPFFSPLSKSAHTVSSVVESSEAPEKGRGESRWSKWLLFLPGAVTFGLGTWQIFRRQEKIQMLEHRKKRLELEPLKLNTVSPSAENPDSLEFRRVLSKGFFDEGRSIYVGPRSRSISGVTENGYYVITPLMPIPNNPECVQSPILVNRGWVPRSWRNSKSSEAPHHSEQPSEVQLNEHHSWWRLWLKKAKTVKDEVPAVSPVEVVGVIRGSENPSAFVPANDPSSGQWFYVDVPAIARASGLPENTIYIEDINEDVNPSNPYPIPKDVGTLILSSVMPEKHLSYTLTWYSLSAAVTFMAYKRLKQRGTRR